MVSAFDYKSKEFDLKINTDSRSFKEGETFVALVGDNFDAFNYVEKVLELGRKLKVTGTPTIFFTDGSRVPGAIDAKTLESRLASAK